MAEKLGLDPIEFRRLNEPPVDPQKDVPFSSRQLLPCLDDGAHRFGWERRQAPGTRREGEWLLGMGVAAAVRNNLLDQGQALVRLTPDGQCVVRTDMTDIGTGSYSILAQIAGEMLGLPIDRVTVELGDSEFPPSAGSGGSWGAGTSGSAVAMACEELGHELARRFGTTSEAMTLKDGLAIARNQSVPIEALVGKEPLEATGTIKAGKNAKRFVQASYGAHFCEVGVNAVTGEVRVRRMLGVFAAGRILNEKTARSQLIGGMIFGIGAALTEELAVDKRHGCFVNHDLAEYHVPVNADVPQIEVHFLAERDDYANPLRSKGIGELGISGSGAAVTNAIYNATGARIRSYPTTLDKILASLP
jgi:xanthine dehydrogenase YagR molybdenum-binding subunit